MPVVISARGLSKRYRIGRRTEDTLRDALAAWARSVGSGSLVRRGPEISALTDASFDIHRGEAVGLIGRNGAGKSTLLKVLSRVTQPTSGTATLHGRVASLLEVGTGFHTELTGRENIFLSGAILGLPKAETAARFDEIVDFAGVEAFIDTPVKRYSSGMFVRLGFAVAAYLEADILLVDEVLAVGDFAFQRKCLGRMRNAASEGRTVVFVSHSMPAIRTLCDRALLLEDGRIVADGPVDQVVRRYLDAGSGSEGLISEETPRLTGTGEALIRRVRLVDATREPIGQVFFGQRFRVQILLRANRPIDDLAAEVGFSTPDGIRVATLTSLDRGADPISVGKGWWELEVEVNLTFQPGEYSLDVALHHWVESKLTIDWVERAVSFPALDVPESGQDHYVHFATSYRLTNVRGYVRAEGRWDEPRPGSPPEAEPSATIRASRSPQ